ncbi:MAG: 4Fe-4S dicluster domain-containing protein, partial [bacterium]
MKLSESVKKAGVVGAGGAGFPTHIKLEQKADWYLANGAECEPLLHKDLELMVRYPEEIVSGLKLAANAVQARQIGIGVKAKNTRAIQALRSAITDDTIRIHESGDFYPSGDEYELVHAITGLLIPPAGIPLDIGVVVSNVETLFQIHQASRGNPVTETFMTVAGCVVDPFTAWIPVGMKTSEILELAGGSTVDDFAVMESGLLMG